MPVNPTLENTLDAIITLSSSLATSLSTLIQTVSDTNTRLDVLLQSVSTPGFEPFDTFTETRAAQVQATETLAGIPDLLMDLYNGIDNLNNNSALNAQNAQVIQLAGIGACCNDIPLPRERAPDHCAKAQSIIDQVLNALDELAVNYPGPVLPTPEQVMDLFTFNAYGPTVPSFMDKAEAGALIAGLQQRGFAGIGELSDLKNNGNVRLRLLNIFSQNDGAETALNQLRRAPFADDGVLEPWDTFIRYGFQPLLMAYFWTEQSYVDGSGYDNTICGIDPPNEPDWSSTRNLLIDDSPPDTSDHSRILAPPAEGPPDGGLFGVRLTLADPNFNGAIVKKLPSLEGIGGIGAVNDEITYTLTSADTGIRIEWGTAPEGETIYVEYLLVGYDPE